MRFRASIWSAGALASFALTTCGDSGPTEPANTNPVVTTIEVTPANPSLFPGDTVQMSATVKDQRGNVISGRTVTWSTSNGSIATIDSSGQLIGVAVGSVSVTAAVDGRNGAASATVADPGPPVVTQSSRASSGAIGARGGSISATADDGTQYVLAIPEGALRDEQQITLTPVTSIFRLPLSGGLAGAVQLSPAGLVFTTPALLRIRTSRTAPGGTTLVGFTGTTDFIERSLTLAASGSGEIVVPVFHFSTLGAGFGTTADLSSTTWTSSRTLEQFLSLLSSFPKPWTTASQQDAQSFVLASFDLVKAELANANDDAKLGRAVGLYWQLRLILHQVFTQGGVAIGQLEALNALGPQAADALKIPGDYVQRHDEIRSLAADALGLAITGNAQTCGSQASLQALRNVFYWHHHARILAVDTSPFGLDIATVRDKLRQFCARVSLQSSNLPGTLTAGAQLELDLRFVLRYNSGATEPTDFQVQLSGSGITIQNPSGFSGIGDAANPLGSYRTMATATKSGTPVFETTACLVLTERVPPAADPNPPRVTGVCATFCVVGSSSAPNPARTTQLLAPPPGKAEVEDGKCEEPALAMEPGIHFRVQAWGPDGDWACDKLVERADPPPAPLASSDHDSCESSFTTLRPNGTTVQHTASASYNGSTTGSPTTTGFDVHFVAEGNVSVLNSLGRVEHWRAACFNVPPGATLSYELTGQIRGQDGLPHPNLAGASATVYIFREGALIRTEQVHVGTGLGGGTSRNVALSGVVEGDRICGVGGLAVDLNALSAAASFDLVFRVRR